MLHLLQASLGVFRRGLGGLCVSPKRTQTQSENERERERERESESERERERETMIRLLVFQEQTLAL